MKRIITAVLSLVMVLGACTFCVSAQSAGTVDSGLDYTERVGAIANPMTGYPSTPFVFVAKGKTAPRNDSGFVHYFIDMRMFAAGYTMVDGVKTRLNAEQTAERVRCDVNAKYDWAENTRNEGGDADIPLTDEAIAFLRGTFENLRKNGGTCLIRPSYAAQGDMYNECYDFEMMIPHAKQLSEIITEYSDVIGAIEIGTAGPFGEQWGSPYCGAQYMNRIMDTYINNTPESVKIMMRKPMYALQYIVNEGTFQNNNAPLGKVTFKDGTSKTVFLNGAEGRSFSDLVPFDNLKNISQASMKRIGLYNDGYMLTGNDTGTYFYREKELPWVKWATTYSYYGGEYGSGSAKSGSQWRADYAIGEMYDTHLTYIHGNIYRSTSGDGTMGWRTNIAEIEKYMHLKATAKGGAEYSTKQAYAEAIVDEIVTLSKTINSKDPNRGTLDKSDATINGSDIYFNKYGYDTIPFTETLAKLTTKADLSAYYGYSVYSLMRDHLGYRFVLRKSEITDSLECGGVLRLKFSVENTGMGNCLQDKVCQLVITDADGKEVEVLTLNDAVNANKWYSQETNDMTVEVRLSNKIEAGKYNAYLRVCNVTSTGTPNTKTNVEFANNGVYDIKLGANKLGSFTLTGTAGAGTTEESTQVNTLFADVSNKYWGRSTIEQICAMGYMNGMTGGVFAPDANTTRGQVVTVLYNMENKPDVSSVKLPFKDVKKSKYYADAVKWAYENKVVNGTSETTFDPEANVTREQFATMLYRYAQYKGRETGNNGDISAYDDAAKISKWAKEAMVWANAKGYVTGMTKTTLAPQEKATRAQLATMLVRFIKNV